MTTTISKGGQGMFFGCAHCCLWENWDSMVRRGENKYGTDHKQYLPGSTLLNYPSSISILLCIHIHIPTKGHRGLWVMLSSLSRLRCGPSWPKALKIKESAPGCPIDNGRKGQSLSQTPIQKRSQSRKGKCCMIPLTLIPRALTVLETGGKWWLKRAGRGKSGQV